MILCFDIGNTNIRGAAFIKGDICRERISFDTDVRRSAEEIVLLLDEWKKQLRQSYGESLTVSGSIISSVVPAANNAMVESIRATFATEPRVVSSNMRFGFEINYDDPSKLGADRIALAAGAFETFPGKNLVVVSIGTAITFNVCLAEKIFDGGAIAPGFGAATEALARQTSQLFSVSFEKPERVAGRNTSQALRSGLYYGWISLIEGIVRRIEMEYGRKFLVILTGGAVHLVDDDIDGNYEIDDDLLMKGLSVLSDRNG